MSKLGAAQPPALVASSRRESKQQLLGEYHDRSSVWRGRRLCIFATVVAMLCGGVGALIWAGDASSSVAKTTPEESLVDDTSRAVDDDFVPVLDELNLSVEDLTQMMEYLADKQASFTCTEINYALCDLSTCSLVDNSASSNIAQCGCLSKVPPRDDTRGALPDARPPVHDGAPRRRALTPPPRPSLPPSQRAEADDFATLALGWASGLMAQSTTYLRWLVDVNATYADHTPWSVTRFAEIQTEACDAIRSNNAAGWATIGASRVSMYGSTAPQIDDASLEDIACPDTIGANCQGAPCFASAGSSEFNLTCLCQATPVATLHVRYSDAVVDDEYATPCDRIAAGPCAVVSGTEYITNMTELDRQIEHIKTQSATLVATHNASVCHFEW